MKPWCSLISGLFLSSAITVPVQAQISLDGTTNTTLIPTDNGIIIDEGNRAGDNLFHSFEQFSVPNGSEAFFNNPNDLVNIFSRVTGGNISNIDGLIRANGDANLFLINPAGIVFGENASLNLGGSFFGSTAESIVFDNNTEFSVTDADNSPLLTINMPIGLNFGNNSGDIAVNDSNLQVNNGETLALLGGDVTITGGQIIAPGANIELGGLTEAGQVSFEGLSFPEGIPRGDITLTNGAEVNVQAAGGGNISINARNLELSGGEFGASNLSAGITSESNSLEAQAGNITINATNNITVSQGSFIANNLEESGVGNAGGIDITTANLSLTQGSLVIASTRGKGDAGTIIIKASETILADGEDQDGNPSGIFQAINPSGIRSMVLPTGEGNSGGINITTANLSLTQGSLVIASTRGKGDAGAITINASATISADGETEDGFSSSIRSIVLPTGEGNSGGINITTANLSLTQGGIVSTTTFGQGNAGAITINASGTISADGGDQAGISGGIFSRVSLAAIGNSGGINITTANLSLTQGSTVNVSTFGQGDAGAININALGTISADGETQTGLVSGIFSEVEKSAIGDSDGINITTANLSLTQGGRVDASTRGQGNAGTITIKASETISADGSGTILADREGRAGSGIFSTAGEFGEGNAADININTNRLSLTKGAEISVESLGQGNAGNLDIQANSLALSNRASLFASTPVGNGGNITLQIADNLTLRDNSTISILMLAL